MKREILIHFGKDLGRFALGVWGIGLAIYSSGWAAFILSSSAKPDGLSIWRVLAVVAIASVLAIWLVAVSSGVIRRPRALPWRNLAVGLGFIASFWGVIVTCTTMPYVFDQTAWLLAESDSALWHCWPVFYGLTGVLVPIGSVGIVVYSWMEDEKPAVDMGPNKRPAKAEAEPHS